jgi:hypothetical protein
LDTTITAETAAEFAGAASGAPNVTFSDQFVDVSIALTDAKGLFQFTSAGDDVTAETVTGAMTDKSAETVASKPTTDSAVTLDYVKELARLVFGTDLLVDALDNEAAIADDYVAKYANCITQALAGGGAAADAVSDRTGDNGPAAAVAAVAGLLNNATSRQRFGLQYNFAPLETFTAKEDCAVYLKASGGSTFSSTALTNFTLDVTMTDANTIDEITIGTISQNHNLATGDTLLIQNQHTGETITTVLTADTAALLNNTSGNLTDILTKTDFGFADAIGITINTTTGTGSGATLAVTVDDKNAIETLRVDNTAGENYTTGSELSFTNNGKTITITGLTADHVNTLNGDGGAIDFLEISSAAFADDASVAFDVSNGTGAELSLTTTDGVPSALTISTAGSDYENLGATVSVTLDSKTVVITLDSQEVNAQLNGLSLTSSVRSATAVTAVKGTGFTAGTGLPVTEVNGTNAAGNGAGALVTVEMAGAAVDSVQETTTGSNYDDENRLIVTNFADGTVISTGSNNANSVQVGILNGNMSGVNVPFEGNDKILIKVSITTPSGQENTANEEPDQFTQTSVLRFSFT